jgi:hypothetical protein
MAECNEKIIFSNIDGINAQKYGFIYVPQGLLFVGYKVVDSLWKKFVIKNFVAFSNCYYASMKFDVDGDKNRKRKLYTFLQSIFDQDNFDVALVMIKAVYYLLNEKYDEQQIIERIIKHILPDAGFVKILKNGGKYVWKILDDKKFNSSIGKLFVLNYINSNFDKDAAWKSVKKLCYYKDNVWINKDIKSKNSTNQAVSNYLKNGGIIVEEKMVNQNFEAFIPLTVLHKELNGSSKFVLEKTVGTEKRMHLRGTAANTSPDREDERLSKNFIKKMIDIAVGLPLMIKSHVPGQRELDDTIGVIEESFGNDNEFGIDAKLQKSEDNINVKKILTKMEDGIRYGFSVGGKITKAFREFNEVLKKEILVLDDGDLFHVLLTDQPVNPDTFAHAIAKSLNKDSGQENKDTPKDMYAFKHSSKLHKAETDAEEVKISELPETAYPINHLTKEIFKDYAHHFVTGGSLYLHKGLLVQAYNKAIQSKAPECIVNHLRTHLQIVGLDKEMIEVQNLIERIDEVDDISKTLGALTGELVPFFKAINSMKNLKVGIEEKKVMLKNVVEDVSTKITKILDTIEIEG